MLPQLDSGDGATPPLGGGRSAGGPSAGRTDPARSDGWNEFDRYFHQAFPRLLAQLHAILGDRELALTAAHEAFARAWLQWNKVRNLPDPASWVRRKATKQVRRSERLQTLSRITGGATKGRRSSVQPDIMMLSALAQLPAVQRRALVLHYMAGLSPERLAEEERISVSTAMMRLAHGRLALGHRLTSNRRSVGDGVLTPAQWATAPIDDWVAKQLTYLGYRLAPQPDIRPVIAVSRTVSRRRRAATVSVVVMAGFGAAVAVILSPNPADMSLTPLLANEPSASVPHHSAQPPGPSANTPGSPPTGVPGSAPNASAAAPTQPGAASTAPTTGVDNSAAGTPNSATDSSNSDSDTSSDDSDDSYGGTNSGDSGGSGGHHHSGYSGDSDHGGDWDGSAGWGGHDHYPGGNQPGPWFFQGGGETHDSPDGGWAGPHDPPGRDAPHWSHGQGGWHGGGPGGGPGGPGGGHGGGGPGGGHGGH
jgi:RNA polymerase sigma-70 factor (ECF subfamily)